ncbi:MAG: HupE/UreJ family protein [Chitinophagia bacterium]|nr:HupE/UreJ family protein [Chitinophagia bacterium]
MWQDFLFYLTDGWRHIIDPGAWDHILFIAMLAIVHAWGDWKRLVILVTAFTIGHSLTLVLSVLDVIRFRDDWVEFAIPCTIAATAAANLLNTGAPRGSHNTRYAMALVFGLVHGMGYANAVRFMLAEGQSLAVGLLGFNTGLEIGQIFVVLSVLLLGSLAARIPGMSRPHWVFALSSCVLAVALWMAWSRLPF